MAAGGGARPGPRPPSRGAARLRALYEAAGLGDAPSPAAAAARLGMKRQIAEGLVAHLVARGVLVMLPGGLVVSRLAAERAIAELRAQGRETVAVGEAKRLLGLTRRVALPFLEWLDREGITRREGETRRLLVRPDETGGAP